MLEGNNCKIDARPLQLRYMFHLLNKKKVYLNKIINKASGHFKEFNILNHSKWTILQETNQSYHCKGMVGISVECFQ